MRTAKRSIEIWDNNGFTVDRYTVLIGQDLYTMSDNPSDPQGINMFSHTLEPGEVCQLSEHDTQRELEQLPEQVQRAIWGRILPI